MAHRRYFRDWAAALFGALLLLFAYVASAQTVTTITNTASVSWREGPTAHSGQSNTVAFTVAIPPAKIETLHPDPIGGAATDYSASTCGGQTITIGAPGGTAGSAALSPASSLRIGEQLVFRFSAPAANIQANAIDSVVATITSTSGDRETITVFETAPDSGVFIGALPTSAIPPSPVSGDCRLSVDPGDRVSIAIDQGASAPVITAQVDILADPFGLVFDSADGTPVNGATVTLVDAVTGLPARVFADDGVTPWPSTVTTGQPVMDGAGNIHSMPPGEYRFPLAPLGTYRLVVTPPAPYSAFSTVQPAQLTGILRPDGEPVLIVPGSYGGPIVLNSPAPVRVDIPVDRPAISVSLTKSVSRALAAPGDVVFYTITARNPDGLAAKRQVVLTDTPSPWLRLRPDSVRLDGAPAPTAVQISGDGKVLTVSLGDVAPGATHTITYAMTVRDDAPPGQALNRVEALDAAGNRTLAGAALRIERETIAGRMTLIGRITDGGCDVKAPHVGIPGVRVMLEDGSFAVTDIDGRYHFEGLTPGTHVVQAIEQTLPEGGKLVDCTRSTRSAGKASSRFISGQGGSLLVADFSAVLPSEQAAASKQDKVASDRKAAGGETDWLAAGDGPIDFLFPAVDHNPRAPAIRVAIRHRKGQTVELRADGKPVDPVAYDGVRVASNGRYAVSLWRGIPLADEVTHLSATVRDADGKVIATLTRDAHFAATPARVELVRDRSKLVADGASRPVLAVRVLDRHGRPVHAGLTGGFQVNAPYESAAALDAMQSRALSGLDRSAPTWTVKGDDGIALIELAPTLVSGALKLDFAFADGQVRRSQTVDAWIVPGKQKWTLIGLAEGSAGARSVAAAMEREGRFDSDLGKHGRVAFYAKGKVLGSTLLTVAYDSAKQRDDQRLLGAIDPQAYYTVFADRSDRRFDAASREKLYIRIESSTFYALYGDFLTGFDQTVLARYQRTATGIKAEGRIKGAHLQGFAMKTAQRHRRDEFQGEGISGPYRLSSRAAIANSEVVTIEVRDRFRSEVIIEQRTLTRFVDYTIDLQSGTISFKEPILSRDAALNPRFIIVDFEVDEMRGGKTDAGIRADFTSNGGKIRVGASAIRDNGAGGAGGERTDLAALDLKVRLGQGTELRAESAVSNREGDTAKAWLVEVEHHDGKFDVLAYAHSTDSEFGIGQTNGAERGRRKFGTDARLSLTEQLSVTASAWYDDSLSDATHREALQVSTAWRSKNTEARLGVASFRDRLEDGSRASSTVLDAGATQRFLGNRLELSAATSIALGKTESIDLPQRHSLGARYAITPDIKAVAAYEIAKGERTNARTARFGVEVAPWAGARVIGTLGQQDIAEFGKRSYTAFGLSQTVPVTSKLTLDATLDASKTIGAFDASRLINPAHPASSGGHLGQTGTLAEDFTAATLGATYRSGWWSATMRAEHRDGQFANRTGLTMGAIRQLGEGQVIGAGFTWTRATGNGMMSEVFDGAISAASRPEDSRFAWLGKLEFRSDKVSGAVAGEAGPAGRSALTIDGDARSRRIIGSVSTNWSPRGKVDGQRVQRSEFGLFLAARHNFDRFNGFDLAGTSLLAGLDARVGIGPHLEVGGAATVRHNVQDGTTRYAIGPQIGFSPADDVLLTIGYNFEGFNDRDFSDARTTGKGVFASIKMKFDAGSLSFLGLGR